MGAAAPVVDASALIALVLGEPGSERVDELISGGAVMSAVNWTEVLDVTASLDLALGERRDEFEQLGIEIAPFTAEQAGDAAALRLATARHGLSLADRACLALARSLDAPCVTGDRAWDAVDAGIDVILFR